MENFTNETLSQETLNNSTLTIERYFDHYMCRQKLCVNPHDECGTTFLDVFETIVSSVKDPEGATLVTKVILTFMYAVVTVVSLIGNSLVIITFALDKHMRSVTNVFILSLAAADLMVTLTCIPFNLGLVFTVNWVFGKFACKLVPTITTFSVACSSLTLCSIALDRYIAIVHPHKLKFLQNPQPASIFLACIWLLSLLCSIPNALFYDLFLVKPKCTRFDGKTIYACFWPENIYKKPLMVWMTLIVLFIVPFLFMLTAYTLIGYRLWIRKPVGAGTRNHENTMMKKKVIQMLIIVMLVFVLCWTPLMVLNVISEMNSSSVNMEVAQNLQLYFQCLSVVSCCCNPVIYTFMNKKFRTKFANYLFCGKNRVFVEEAKHKTTAETNDALGAREGHRMSQGNMIPRSG